MSLQRESKQNRRGARRRVQGATLPNPATCDRQLVRRALGAGGERSMRMHTPMMRRTLLPTAFVALALLLAWSMPDTAAAHGATRAASGNGTITGTVLNGSKGNVPVTGQTVTLDMYVSHAQTQSAATTTTDAHGHFSFGGLDGSGSTIYQLDVKYANGNFTSATIDFASGPSVDQTITVYDTTSDPSALSVTNTTMLFSSPNTQTGLIPVGVFITFKNSG